MKSTLSKTKKAAAPSSPRGSSMNGAETLVACLEREGVDTIFAYPGGASQFLHQALTKSKKIRTILPRHEQGGGFMAAGYARATGKVGVCMATSGPGATNLVTALADAYMDSIPLVSVTGQVPQANIGKGAFQETDFFGMTLPVVKHSYLVLDITRHPAHREGGVLHRQQRPARPGDHRHPEGRAARQDAADLPRRRSNLRGYNPEAKADDLALNEVLGLIEKAERPVLYVGGGIISSGASKELLEFAELTNIPGDDDADGHRLFPGEPSALAEVARHARHLLREPRGERGRPAAGLRRALRRPRDRQGVRVRQARHHRPHRHRLRRVQQEQARAPADPERREVRAGPAQRDHPQGRPRAEDSSPAGRRIDRVVAARRSRSSSRITATRSRRSW